MDIRNWPMDRILQLPDYCLSRRFVVACHLNLLGGVDVWDMSEIALPERFILWEFNILMGQEAFVPYTYRMALGDRVPASHAEFMALEPLLPGVGAPGPEPRLMFASPFGNTRMSELKTPYISSGRRLVVEIENAISVAVSLQFLIVVSSVPTEVPDWIVSV